MTDTKKTDPIRPTDDDARRLGRSLLADARFAALGTVHPTTGRPQVTRVSVALLGQRLVTLISDLSNHSAALQRDPHCGLLIGEPGSKGDPLTHPRLSLHCTAAFLSDKSLRDAYLSINPKAALYIDFADFRFVDFGVSAADLNGGFGKAYRLDPSDLNLTHG